MQLVPRYNKLNSKENSLVPEILVIHETEEDILKGTDDDYVFRSRRRAESDEHNSQDSEQGSQRTDPCEKKITDEAEVPCNIGREGTCIPVEFEL